jgi:hypothetical protein
MALALLLVSAPGEADARPRPAGKSSKQFEANKGFGLGIMLGVPSGLSGKVYVGTDTAIDFGIGTYYGGRRGYNDGFHLHADFLWHPLVVADPDPFWVPLYIGVGARFLDHGNDGNNNDDTHVGVRVPAGIMMDFNNVPLDIFFEIAFVFDILRDDGRHGRADFQSAIGIRYYFN